MRGRVKGLIIIAAALAGVLIFLVISSRTILLQSFARLEERDTRKNLERATAAIREDLDGINTVAGDYAGWDEAYRFVLDGNKAFIKTNLAEAIFPKLRLNYIIFVDTSANIIYANGFDLLHDRPIPVPPSLLQILTVNSRLVTHPSTDSTVTGLLKLPDGMLLIASRPVLTSDYKGPIHGSIVMGRYLDESEVKRLAERTRLPLSVLPYEPGVASLFDPASSHTSIAVRATNSVVSGYTILPDLEGRPTLVMKIEQPRMIYHQGVQTIRYFLVWFLAVSLVILVLSHLFLKKLFASFVRNEENEARYRSVVEQASEGILLVDAESGRILEANVALQDMLGFNVNRILEMTLQEIAAGGEADAALFSSRLQGERRSVLVEQRFLRRDGSEVDVSVSAGRISYGGRNVLCLVVHDITERKRFEQELIYQANHDSLTGLPNRNILRDRLTHAMAYDRRVGQRLCVMLLDLDHFKLVNDTLGHSAGDLLLRKVAERLQQSVRSYDTVTRIGGDEFTILLYDVPSTGDIIAFAEKLLHTFDPPFDIEGHEVFVTVSIGITIYPADGDNVEMLIRNADTAMYHVKERGRNGYQFFAEEMNRKVQERLGMETKMRRAMERDEFVIHYQPRVDLATGKMVGMEALIRWQSPDGPLVPPYKFVPLLEDTGLIVPVGLACMRDACMQTRKWQEMGFPPLRIAVNLSGRHFALKNLPERIEQILEETGLSSDCLEIELTEGILMQDAEDAVRKLKRLKDMGIKIAVDDFGTGYSSLGYLKRFPIDDLKIDKSFVNDITTSPDASTIATTIITMAHSLKLKVVAEGVETASQLAFLIEHECEEMQGYYFSRPVTVQQFEELLRSGKQLEVNYQLIARSEHCDLIQIDPSFPSNSH